MADTLDDDFYVQENIVADSGDEGAVSDDNSDNVNSKPEQISKKRNLDSQENKEKPPNKKKRKRKRITEELAKNKPVNAKKEELVTFIHSNYDGKLSSIEWDDLQLDKDRDLFEAEENDKPSDYMNELLPKWSKLLQTSLKPGSPLVLVLTASAIRAVELNRELVDFKTDKCKTAKLFGKHLKTKEQQVYLNKNVCHVAVGTPLRVYNLIKSDSLKLDKLVAVILDWNKRDVKSKRMIDIPEVKQGLLELLKGGLVTSVHNTKAKFALL